MDSLNEDDIGLVFKNHKKYFDKNPHGLKFDFNKTDAIFMRVYNNTDNYEVVVKYIDNGDRHSSFEPYSIKAKVKLKGYSINTLDSQSFFYHGLDFDNVATALQLPIELNFFKINGKKFALLATVCPVYETKGRYLYTRSDQKFLIVDKEGNIYASFSYDNYEIYQQLDSDKYNFKPVIASYIIIRGILTREIK